MNYTEINAETIDRWIEEVQHGTVRAQGGEDGHLLPAAGGQPQDVRAGEGRIPALRILKPGGLLMAGLDNGVNFLFDEDENEGEIRYSLPFNPLKDQRLMALHAGGIEKKLRLLTMEKADISSLFMPKRGTAL